MARYLFLLFTVVPFIELYLLLTMGRNVGLVPTLAFVVGTGLLGAFLARREGTRVLRDWQVSMAQGRIPEDGILSGALILVGGALLVAPGVLTDLTGMLLLIPPTRRFIAARIRRVLERRRKAGTFRVSTFGMGGFGVEDSAPREGARGWPSSVSSRRQPGEVDAEFTEDGSRGP